MVELILKLSWLVVIIILIVILLWVAQELACGFPEVFSIGKY